MEEVNPDQTAGGGHVFSPLVDATPTSLLNDDDDSDLAGITPAHLSGAAAVAATHIEVQHNDSSTAVSSDDAAAIAAAVAAAVAATSMDTQHDGSSAATSGFTPTDMDQGLSSAATSAIAGSSSTLLSSASDSRKGKKRRNDSDIMPPPSKKSASSSSRVSSHADSASTSGTKARTPSMNVMVNQMDNTVNRLMDMFNVNAITERRQAIMLLQAESQAAGVEAGWDNDDVALMIEVFSRHTNLAESYVAMEGPLRRQWVLRTLEELRPLILQGMTMRKAARTLGDD